MKNVGSVTFGEHGELVTAVFVLKDMPYPQC